MIGNNDVTSISCSSFSLEDLEIHAAVAHYNYLLSILMNILKPINLMT